MTPEKKRAIEKELMVISKALEEIAEDIGSELGGSVSVWVHATQIKQRYVISETTVLHKSRTVAEAYAEYLEGFLDKLEHIDD